MDFQDQYYLFADESVQDGKLFSNFYGGALVPLSDYEGVSRRYCTEASKMTDQMIADVQREFLSNS